MSQIIKQPATFVDLIKNPKTKQAISMALPSHIKPDRIISTALRACNTNPEIAKCNPLNVLACVIQSAQLGLQIGVLGQAFLIPYKGVCTLVPGWRGLVDIAHRSGQVRIWTNVVREGDSFRYQIGTEQFISHTPGDEIRDDKITHAYACGEIKGFATKTIECWTIEKINKHRDKYNKVGDKHYSYREPEMYARKVVLLQLLKYLPQSIELQQAIDLDVQAEAGEQKISVEESIDGQWFSEPKEQPQTQSQQIATTNISAIAEDKGKK